MISSFDLCSLLRSDVIGNRNKAKSHLQSFIFKTNSCMLYTDIEWSNILTPGLEWEKNDIKKNMMKSLTLYDERTV